MLLCDLICILTIILHTRCIFFIVLINVDIYGLTCLAQRERQSQFVTNPLFTWKVLMTQEERGGIVGIYSSGVKMTLKVWFTPMKTTSRSCYICNYGSVRSPRIFDLDFVSYCRVKHLTYFCSLKNFQCVNF